MRRIGLGLLMVLMVSVAVVPAARASGWAVQKVPAVMIANAQLDGTSCPATTNCTAVGSSIDGAGTRVTLAAQWTGSSWSIQSTPNPAGATSSTLSSVSCVSATACTAVGSYNTSGTSGPRMFAERLTSVGWAVQTLPAPAGATTTSLGSVSCTAANACTAVGVADNSSGLGAPLAERWNGSSWSVQTTPAPGGAHSSTLQSVSCTSTICTAVGDYVPSGSSNMLTLAEWWNGTSWAIQSTPNPNFTVANLAGVSCTSSSACTAVGYAQRPGSETVTLAERWNGSAWALQSTPNPSPTNPGAAVLNGVSCASTGACTAVGTATDSAGTPQTLAEGWGSGGWSIQSTPNPAGALASALTGISCTSTSACTAVGNDTNASGTQVTVAERWNGTSWTIQSTPVPAGAITSTLTGVSCQSTTACIAVGTWTNSSSTQAVLAESWNGNAWSIQTTPIPGGAQQSALSAVACSSTSACTAAGDYTDSTGTPRTLAERLSGTTWSVQTPANPANTTSINLNGVSCSAATACTAVGVSTDRSYTRSTLAEEWSGTSWSIEATPIFASPLIVPTLQGVACTATSTCTAVGEVDSGSSVQLPLAESE